MSANANKIKTQQDFYNEVSQLLQSQMEQRANETIEYKEPHPKVEKTFNKSVASLGDIYKSKQDNDDYVELLDGTVIIPSIETKGIKRNLKTGKTSSSIALRNKGEVNDIFLDPSSIAKGGINDDLMRKARAKDINYLHMAKLEDSSKYRHVANGVINPPQSHFSVKNIIIDNIKSHERGMQKVIVYPNRVRIHHVQPDKKTHINQSPNTNTNANHLVVIGRSINMNQINDNHVHFTKPKEIKYKPRALSSKTARKTLLVSEKFVGAVGDYFNSSEMKIPSKNTIDQIVTYAQDVEKYLNDYSTEMGVIKKAAKKTYKDPFSKQIKNRMKPGNPPPKIYPVIEDDYQKKVMEKLSRLQGDLRQIFDALSQQRELKADDSVKVNTMIDRAKELTRLIKHLADDVNKSKEISLKRIKDAKEKEKPKGDNKRLIKNRSVSQTNIYDGATGSKMNQSIQLDQLKTNTITSSIIKNHSDSIGLYPQVKTSNSNNKVIVSAINPVQESMMGASLLKESTNALNTQDQPLCLVQSINKRSSVSFGNDTIIEEKSKQPINQTNVSMSLPNYNSTINIQPQQQKKEENNKTLHTSQSQPNSLYYYSPNLNMRTSNNRLSQSIIDPNITLNNFQVEASKIKVDSNQAIRDERFTSFNIELPVQYYFQVSKDHEPNKEREWYIRPHHIESFTKSENAIPDDVLNTKYISYICEADTQETKTRQKMLEEMLAETRGHIDQLQYDLFSKCQTDKMKERLYARLEAIKEEAKKDYVPGQIIDKERKNEKVSAMFTSGEPKSYTELFEGNEEIYQANFAIDTFSKLLNEIRNKEKELLIKKRQEEYERIRPPMKNWYELKGSEFQNELKRNKMVINADPEYFEKIKQLTNTELY